MKKVARHIDVDMTYDEALPHMKDLDEFKELGDEDRKVAYGKFIDRQKVSFNGSELTTGKTGRVGCLVTEKVKKRRLSGEEVFAAGRVGQLQTERAETRGRRR